MPVNQIIPIYIVAGFLDSGKTTLIHNMIDDESFSRGQKTLLVVCEDGEEEYDAEKLAKQKVTLHMVDSVEVMTPSLFVDLNKQYKPERVIIEYNNTFTFAKLDTMQLPPKWELVQVIDMVDATTFDSYMNNMRQLMTDPMQNADLILFNRCENDMNVSAWRRQLRAMNSTTTILFEYNDGHSDDGVSDEDLPYDMKADVIDISEENYGTFYLDALDHPNRYDDKVVRFKGQVFAEPGVPKGFFRFGRLAMTCCANDITCLGFLCRGDLKPSKTQWYTLTAKAQTVYNKAQDHEVVALMQVSAEPTEKAKDQYVTFN